MREPTQEDIDNAKILRKAAKDNPKSQYGIVTEIRIVQETICPVCKKVIDKCNHCKKEIQEGDKICCKRSFTFLLRYHYCKDCSKKSWEERMDENEQRNGRGGL